MAYGFVFVGGGGGGGGNTRTSNIAKFMYHVNKLIV